MGVYPPGCLVLELPWWLCIQGLGFSSDCIWTRFACTGDLGWAEYELQQYLEAPEELQSQDPTEVGLSIGYVLLY